MNQLLGIKIDDVKSFIHLPVYYFIIFSYSYLKEYGDSLKFRQLSNTEIKPFQYLFFHFWITNELCINISNSSAFCSKKLYD